LTHRKTVFALAAIVLVILMGWGAWLQFSLQRGQPILTEPLVVAYSPYEAGALFWIARDQRYFEEQGLNLTLKRYDSGAASLQGLVEGDVDLSVGVSEFPLVRQAFQNARVRTLGNIDKGEFIYLVADRDRVGTISNLKGKRVGTALGTIAEFHLGRFLSLHGMTIQDITLIDTKTPTEWMSAAAEGEIDAVSTAQPFADAARDRLGDRAIVWSVQSNQPVFSLILARDEWIADHPDKAVGLLRAFEQAEAYAARYPLESRAIVQRELDLDAGYMDSVWRQNQFSLTLDQSLIIAMEDEARWMIRNHLTDATEIPDFRTYVYTEALETIKPGAVKIIG
jgi:ABC-type nitrate/sulfonate/bicarbonate transport systems, periplasmic components